MKFKEGDLVEVIKEDYYLGFPFPKGSQWIVYEDQSDYNNMIKVYDYRNSLDYSVLWVSHVKKIERFKPLFKVGDMVKVKSSYYINDSSIGNIYKVEEVVTSITENDGLVCLYTGVNNDYTKTWAYSFDEVELVGVDKGNQMELYELIQKYEALRNTNKKLEEENEILKKENQTLLNRNGALRAKRDTKRRFRT